MKSILCNALLAGLVITTAPAFANRVIVCTERTPHFNESGLVKKAYNVGTVLVAALDAKAMIWALSGSINSLTAAKAADGTEVVGGIDSSNDSSTERLIAENSRIVSYQTYPATYGIEYTLTMKDALGAVGTAIVSLEGKDINSMNEGYGSWANTSGSKVKFAYCTDKVVLR